MKTTHRTYSEEAGDFNRLCRFVVEDDRHTRQYSTWCLGRVVDWKYGLYGNKLSVAGFCDKNACLWFDAFGEMAGFAISERGDSGFALLTAAGYRFLFGEMLAWVLANWGDRGPCFSIEITERQTIEAGLLEKAGFHCRSTFYARHFDLTREPAKRFPLEEGFAIVDMAAHPDFRQQRLLRANAFGHQDILTEEELRYQLMFYNHAHEGPIYHPECDLCVMAPDGRFVAGCEALIDARNVSADIERVCTHGDFRRRGFSRAVIQECMRRLRDMGIRDAYIAGYSPEALALYGSLGHAGELKCFVYEMPMA
jgi:GNAT superfamily N-acetyltransferase